MSKNYGEIENFAEDVVDLFNDLEIKIMDKMVDLIKENGFSGASSDYLMNRLRSLGVAEEDVAKYFEEALKGTEIKLNQIFDDEVYQEYYGHARDFKAVGYDQIPYKDNVELQQLVDGIHTQTFATIGGLSRSLGFVLRQPGTGELIPTRLQTFYQSQLDEAVLDISSGAFSYGQVIERVINRMTNSGVRIINFESGVNRSMVSQVRTAILTGFRQIQSHINEDTAQKLGTEYFEVSYHVGARPTHQPWQGRVWSKEELTTVCGLGSVTGLCGANCYHSYLPFIPGISVRTYTDEELDEMLKQENQKKSYNGKEYTTYEALQQQRYLERTARKYRQDIKLMQRGFIDGESNDDLKDALLLKQARYKKTVAQYNDFSKKMGLPLQRDRIYKDGLGRIKVPEKTIARRTEVFTAKDGSVRVRKAQKNISSQEKERIHIPDTGKDGPGHVNTKVVNKKVYHDKFDGLIGRKAADESLYDNTLQVLLDNNDTGHEHILAINAREGTLLVKNTSHADAGIDYQCGFSKEELEYLSSLKLPFVVLHNHPNNSIPSRDDIQMLFKRPYQDGSVISCHNGDVYVLKKLKEFKNIDTLVGEVYHEAKEKYQDYEDDKIEYECSMRLIKLLKRGGVLGYDKR